MVHDGNVVDCPATRAAADVDTDHCRACPVFEYLVDDETLAYVVCGVREPAPLRVRTGGSGRQLTGGVQRAAYSGASAAICSSRRRRR